MDVFSMFAKLGLNKDEYEDGLDEAEGKGKKFTSALGGAFGGLVKGVGVALGASATGITALTTASVKAYGDYEQLVGGTELLFGEAFDFVMEKSQQAYSTVQMSQNEYLQQVNGFATGLKTSLGGSEQASAELADKIINAEADIVSATGASQEAVQNAFNGIMKSNFTMVDNLQLGITPTKEGFQEMIDSVNAWNEAQGRMTNYTIDNLADCESALVDYVEMQGLAGYASNEASGTIQGSIASMKGAWTDFVAGLANPDADIGMLINNMVTTANTALHNLAPAVMTALTSIGKALPQIAPIINEYLPSLIGELLPPIIETATILIDGLVEALPEIFDAILPVLPEIFNTIINATIELLPMLLSLGGDILLALANAITENLPTLIPAITEIISNITMELTSPSNIVLLGNTMKALITALATSVIDNFPQIVDAFFQGCVNIATTLYENWDEMIEGIGEFIQSITDSIMDGFVEWLGLSDEQLADIADAFDGAINDIIGFFTGGFDDILDISDESLDDLFGSFDGILGSIKEVVNKGIEWLKGAFKFEWKLPDIKLPHFSVSGGVAPYGLGGGTPPSFSIKWYAKGYEEAMLLDNATIFGMDRGGNLLGGGEKSGTEAVVGTELLMNMIQSVVNSELKSLNFGIYLDGDTLVGGIAPRMDNELGRLSNLEMKGAY